MNKIACLVVSSILINSYAFLLNCSTHDHVEDSRTCRYKPFISALQTTVLHMKRLNQTESPIFLILCVLCFQRQSIFFTFITEFMSDVCYNTKQADEYCCTILVFQLDTFATT